MYVMKNNYILKGGINMNIASKIQKKCDEIWNDNYFEDSKIKRLKAFGAAVVSGVIDGAVIAYPIMIAINLYESIKK